MFWMISSDITASPGQSECCFEIFRCPIGWAVANRWSFWSWLCRKQPGRLRWSADLQRWLAGGGGGG